MGCFKRFFCNLVWGGWVGKEGWRGVGEGLGRGWERVGVGFGVGVGEGLGRAWGRAGEGLAFYTSKNPVLKTPLTFLR